MRTIKLTLAYDGTPYHGWQVQPGVPTVQGLLQGALERLLDQEIVTHGSGRTDAGVHAHAQVAHFETDRSMDTDALHRGVNALLPPDIRIHEVEEVSPDFHARISAQSKTYEYHVWRDPVVSPFHRLYVYPLSRFLYVYINKDPNKPLSPLEQEFVKMVFSRQGQEVVLKDGYIPLPALVVERFSKELGL